MTLSRFTISILLLTDINISVAQEENKVKNTQEVQSDKQGKGEKEETKDLQSLKDINTSIQNPFSLRDPFQRDIPNSALKKIVVDAVRQSAVEVALKNVPLKTIKIIGVLLGKNRRAIAQIGTKTYMLKEGMYIGPGSKKLEVILPGGIVLVEKTTNVYDEDEYLETIIPVSNALQTNPR